MGREGESIAEGERAVHLDPLSVETNDVFGLNLYFLRQYDEANVQFQKVAELDPNDWMALTYLACGLEQKGQLSNALQLFHKLAASGEHNPWLFGEHGRAYVLSGKTAEARKVLLGLEEQWQRKHIGAYDIAIVCSAQGKKDQALAWLEKAYEDRSYFLVDLKVGPDLDPVRSDPRFQALLRRMNFPP